MACGVPAVVSGIVGCGPDLIDPGVTGAVFPCGDVTALARAIEAVLHADRDEQRRLVARRISTYSPAAAAQGVIEGAAALRR